MTKSHLYLSVEEIKSIEQLKKVELPLFTPNFSDVSLVFVRIEGNKSTEFPAIAIFNKENHDIEQLIDIKNALHYYLHKLDAESEQHLSDEDDYEFTQSLPEGVH